MNNSVHSVVDCEAQDHYARKVDHENASLEINTSYTDWSQVEEGVWDHQDDAHNIGGATWDHLSEHVQNWDQNVEHDAGHNWKDVQSCETLGCCGIDLQRFHFYI